MIIVRAARLGRRGVGAASGTADSGRTHPLGDDFVILSTYWTIPLRAFAGRPVPQGCRRAPAGSRRETTALRLHRDRLTRQLGDECTECPRVGTASADESGQVPPATAADPGGAYLTVTRRRETGRRDRKRLRVTLRRPGLQGTNPGKKERS
jgi:hypothetical protein